MQNEREEVRKKIWSIADNLRNSVDGWDFKQYVLGMMFYRYISENFANSINKNEWDSGRKDYNYADSTDQEVQGWEQDRINAKGFFIKPSELFENVLKESKVDNQNLNEKLNNIFQNIMGSARGTNNENNFSELFIDVDLNNNKLGSKVEEKNKRIRDLLIGISAMPLYHEENKFDAFGDAYEFLMGMYASNAGKSGGEFYTPPEVSELLTHLAINGKEKINKVYDPACGSGSLLLKFKKILGKDKVNKYCGQEINLTTCNLCRMNMFLHNINYNEFDIKHGDTLLDPDYDHWMEAENGEFDAIVSNPPYSTKWVGDDRQSLLSDERFSPAGVLAPKSKADMAFVMHCLHYLSNNGTAAIVCFPGIMYRTGKEQKIRKYLIDNNHVDCVISLASNLFYGTQTPTCIMVLKKNKKDSNILFIDATKEFIKVKNSNKLTEQNIQNILNAYKERTDKQYFCRLVTHAEVTEQKWNLSVDTYVEKEDTREKIDIKELNAKIASTVEKINYLRSEIDQIIKEIESDSNDQSN
ncbi:restriction endonuclease [Candidatus Mycoplasma haematobovis]|uniref:site-specific DNA-methyltransferase (adenine-specific) n=1 Tax=Candidatus Mycoplasma haematobovis TaxID=432608 RepID=A0A1A9QDG8_9MOLU|nr:type I restriction-modification system subunit M [Candidatus Mycoplasma haematobovis]OAL09739.1 restriction endonuclease [Candidatus Mycoplasma haematobovis]